MNVDLEQWLAEIRDDGVAFADQHGGANKNLWSLSLPRPSPITADDVVAFVLAAAAIRKALVVAQRVAPITFYAWHDEMAGQLRFSTARCTPDSLPFSAAVRVVPELEDVVQDFVESPYRDGLIPWSAVRTDTDSDAVSGPDTPERDEALKVWAQRLA